ncbi:uncharacterized protein LOC133922912 [Phragmites australis]|uniref:uncharacterized protein LOC133922912 n=1 Tax=Phragmites australis TaxID=29695 RepID=UPI002D76D11E|nr:uncharacterized protein LOC133922912 [Phragmites australis]
MLTRDSYTDWSLLMKVMMKARGLWEAVEVGGVDQLEDLMAMDAILKAVSLELMGMLVRKGSTLVAWDTVKSMYAGSKSVRKLKAQQLCLGDVHTDEMMVHKFLRVLPTKFSQITLSIETMLDLENLFVEEQTERLKVVEDRKEINNSAPSGSGSGEGKLLLSELESLDEQKEAPLQDYVNNHRKVVHLEEGKVLAQLDRDEAHDDSMWYLDTEAMNHMTGVLATFSDLDQGVGGTIKFGDGSLVNIEGRGMVLFECKNGEHSAFSGVYYISCLTTDIISIGQLDDNGCEVRIKEVLLRIWDRQRRLVMRVQRSASRLYLLRLNLAKPVCLSARHQEIAWTWHTAKSDAPAAIKNFQASVETETGRKLHVLRTDIGGEFASAEFAEYCAGRGVQHHLSAPYSPQQNGVVERRNQMVLAMVRSLLKSCGVPATFWGEAVTTAIFLLNRSSTKSVSDMTPFEAWHGRKPAVHYLRTFGCVEYVKITKPHLAKLANRSFPGVFIGYQPGVKAYRLYDPTTGRVHITRDVVFREDKAWDWSK